MKLKKLLALSLAGVLSVGMVVGVSAAELDTVWYAANNPDVVAALGDSPAALQQHYDTYGRKEGRMANSHDVEAKLRRLFDAKEYAALYPDVKAAFGEDEEAMFQHYISYGLLETRRPSEKVSYEAAVALKTAVVTAMEKAGIVAVPGSAEVVAVIEGDIEVAAAESAATVEALIQVTAEVEKAVEATVESTETSASTSSSSGSSSSSNTSSNSSETSEETTSSNGSEELEETEPEVDYDVESSETEPGKAIVAHLVDVSGNEVDLTSTETALKNVIDTTILDKTEDGVVKYTYALVTFGDGEIEIPQHCAGNGEDGYWVGIGVPYEYEGVWGFADSREAAVDKLQALANDSSQITDTDKDSEMEDSGKMHYTFYWGLSDEKSWGYLIVCDTENDATYGYVVDFSKLSKGSTRAESKSTSSES